MICFLRVCLGNMFRFASIESFLKPSLNRSIFEIDFAYVPIFCQGSFLYQHSMEASCNYCADVTNQKSRSFIKKYFQSFDYIYAMSSSNYEDVINMTYSKQEEGTASLILNILHSGENQSVLDLYYDFINGFKQAYHVQEQFCFVTASELA